MDHKDSTLTHPQWSVGLHELSWPLHSSKFCILIIMGSCACMFKSS